MHSMQVPSGVIFSPFLKMFPSNKHLVFFNVTNSVLSDEQWIIIIIIMNNNNNFRYYISYELYSSNYLLQQILRSVRLDRVLFHRYFYPILGRVYIRLHIHRVRSSWYRDNSICTYYNIIFILKLSIIEWRYRVTSYFSLVHASQTHSASHRFGRNCSLIDSPILYTLPLYWQPTFGPFSKRSGHSYLCESEFLNAQ